MLNADFCARTYFFKTFEPKLEHPLQNMSNWWRR